MDTLVTVLGILLGVTLLFGVYKLATAHLRERSSLKPSSETAPRQAIKATFTIIVSIILIITIIFAFRYFTAQ